MNEVVHMPPALLSQATSPPYTWSGLPPGRQVDASARVSRWWAGPMGPQCRLCALRTVGLAGVLILYMLMERIPGSGGALREGLTAVLLAVTVSIAQTLLTRRVASQPGGVHAIEGMLLDMPSVRQHAQDAMELERTAQCAEPAADKTFDDAVRRALSHLSDPTKLATSPLLHLSQVSAGLQDQGLQDTRLHRAAILKAILVGLLEGLRPLDQAGSQVTGAWRFYNCLYYPYVVGTTRRQAPTVVRELRERRLRDGGARSDLETALSWLLQVDEDTYYKWQRRASDIIALTLRERERLVGALPPRP